MGSPRPNDSMLETMQRHSVRALAVISLGMLAACASQPEPRGEGAGLLAGLFHGLTALIALVASLFMPIRPYAFPNTGFWYDAGFCLGFSFSIILLVVTLIAQIGGFLTRKH